MTAFLGKLIEQHFVFLMSVALSLIAVVLVLAIAVYRTMRKDAKAKATLKEEARFIRAIVAWFRPTVLPKPGEVDPLAETAMPFKAVADPRTSGEQK